jgi:hypothetical protein
VGVLAAYRRTGADLPFTDLRRPHGTAFEGWYWRITHASSGTVVAVLAGVNRAADGRPWGLLGIAVHPGGIVRDVVLDDPRAVRPWHLVMGDALRAGERELIAAAGDARVEVQLDGLRRWPRRAFGGIGPAQALPALTQYWHPWLLGARVRGRAIVGDRVIDLDGAQAYAEKNWGNGGFPETWWWGQAQGFDREDACVAFAGGRAGVGPIRTTATSLVVAVGDEVLRIVRPLQGDAWTFRGRTAGGTVVEVEGHANGTAPHLLPVPIPAEGRVVEQAAAQHLAGELRVSLRRRGRIRYEGVSCLAGLERGNGRSAPPPAAPPAPAPRRR